MASVSIAARDSLRFSWSSRSAEHPAARRPHEVDAASGVEALQLAHDAGHVAAIRQSSGQHGLLDRLGRGEHQRLHDADVVLLEPPLRGVLKKLRYSAHHRSCCVSQSHASAPAPGAARADTARARI
jgi:hypothetical protein